MKNYLTKTLCDFISIPSVSGNEEKLAQRIYSELKNKGLNVKIDSDGNVIARTGKGNKRLIFNGHIDTVPAENWGNDPFKPRIIGDKVCGRGASDMKSGLAVMMYLAQNVKPELEVYYTFTICEERSDIKTNGAKKFCEKLYGNTSCPGTIAGNYFISLEPAVDDKIKICIGSQGRMTAKAEILGKAAHSSVPHLGDNAISTASGIVSDVDKINKKIKPYKVYGNCYGKAAMSVTEIKAGTASNIIPDLCSMTIDRRIGLRENTAVFRKEIDHLFRNVKYKSLFVKDDHPKGITNLKGELFSVSRLAFKEVLGEPEYIVSHGAFDAGYFSEKGIDVIGIGPGLRYQCHVENEYCRISDMIVCTEVLRKIISKLTSS